MSVRAFLKFILLVRTNCILSVTLIEYLRLPAAEQYTVVQEEDIDPIASSHGLKKRRPSKLNTF